MNPASRAIADTILQHVSAAVSAVAVIATLGDGCSDISDHTKGKPRTVAASFAKSDPLKKARKLVTCSEHFNDGWAARTDVSLPQCWQWFLSRKSAIRLAQSSKFSSIDHGQT